MRDELPGESYDGARLLEKDLEVNSARSKLNQAV